MLKSRRFGGRPTNRSVLNWTTVLLLVVLFPACYSELSLTDSGYDNNAGDRAGRTERVQDIDFLVVVDNSGSMRENQTLFAQELEYLFSNLVSPPDLNGDGLPDQNPVRSIHFGVVSTDLGGPEGLLADCADRGDDGFLNPIQFGPATSARGLTPGIQPTFCRNSDLRSAFLRLDASHSNIEQFTQLAQCSVLIDTFGCGIEQPLEAAYRALVLHRADAHPDASGPASGFLRDDSLLVILVLSDEEDGSVRNCRYPELDARRQTLPCQDAMSVFDPRSQVWSSNDVNLRHYLYRPCSAQDPTWNLDRYLDPRSSDRGFLRLKPRHPEHVIFAAITGVPIELPTSGSNIDWDLLLGRRGSSISDLFCGRDPSTSLAVMSREGPISLRQADQDPSCPQRVVPGCRRENSAYEPGSCLPSTQYFAWPARRLIEVARRFDENVSCFGHPCHNGLISSICAGNYRRAMSDLVRLLQRRLR